MSQLMWTYKTIRQNTLIIYQSLDSLHYGKNQTPYPQKSVKQDKIPDTIPTVNVQPLPTTQLNQQKDSNKRKYPKDDYQKNITINVVKCCIRSMLSKTYQKRIKRQCLKYKILYDDLRKMMEPILKQVVISLGDLKNILIFKNDQQLKLKTLFLHFIIWHLRKKYMYYLLIEGKMSFKQRYIQYKNKYVLHLLMMIKQQMDEVRCKRMLDTSIDQ